MQLKSGGHSNRKIVESIVYSPGGKLSIDWLNWRFKDWLKIRIKQCKYKHLRKTSVGKMEPDFTQVLSSELKSKKILLVDDDEELKEKLKGIFANSNSEVMTAGNGLEAIDFLLKDQDFDLVVSDIDMPEMTGLEFLSEVKRRGIACPEIYMMSGGGDENLKAALELGAFKAFSKYKIEELIEAVERK